MRKYKNLTIIGTSHVAIESVKEVEQEIRKIKPDIVALELDRARFNALVYKKRNKFKLRDIKKIGFKGFLFNLIGSIIEKRLGKIVNVAPGSEMKKAVEISHKFQKKIALIDQDITVTLRKLSKSITFKEKFNFLGDFLKIIFFKRQKVKFDLKKVPNKEIIKKLIKELKERYPNIYKVLIQERDKFMAKYLYSLMQDYNNVLAIVGAGHEDSIIWEIKKLEDEIIRQKRV